MGCQCSGVFKGRRARHLPWAPLSRPPRPRAYARGVGVTPPFSLIFYEKFITCAKEINCFRILFACWFVDVMQISRNEFACKFPGTLWMGQKVIIRYGRNLRYRLCSRHLMVCTFIPIKQPKSSRKKRTSTHGNQHSFKKNVTAMTKNIRLLPSNEKQTAWKD